MTTTERTPTDRWLATAEGMPPLGGPAGTAERLLLLLHYGIDWNGWIGRYRARYWDAMLADRVVVAAYRAGSLPRWWSDVATELGAQPRSRDERRELDSLLHGSDDGTVLTCLREETEALVLRLRITAEMVRDAKGTGSGGSDISGRHDA